MSDRPTHDAPADVAHGGPARGETAGSGHPHAGHGAAGGAPVYPPGYDPITHTFRPPAAEAAAPAAGGVPAVSGAVCPVDHTAFAARPTDGVRRTMVVTGASRGIGHAIVRKFAAEGWRILTISRHPFESARCPWEAGPEDHVQVDLVDRDGVAHAIRDIRTKLEDGPLNALVNNAGISPKGPNGERQNSLTTPMETWMRVFHVNLLAPILLARGLFDELKAGQGAIVNITSVVGHKVHPFAGTAYATSKAALTALTREMAADFAPHGIRVNAIAPGEIFTDILSPGTEEKFLPLIPMHRLGRPEEVAELVHFLCSQAASYITGEEININGGQLL
jgi:NAD(P)-dependent dehydrogenase (short-subunit alcohol dehydrogenase family)